MMFSRSAVLIVVVAAAAALSGADAFSPLSPQHNNLNNNINNVVQDSQRYLNTASQFGSPTSLALDNDDEDVLALTDDIDSPPADDYIVNVGDFDDDDEEVGSLDDGEPPAWYASQQRVDELRAQFRRHDKDTGSPEYQVAGMTERISYLTKHLQVHPKDFSTRRGLVALVNKRRRLLNYLYREDEQRYSDVVKSLGIRHKAPGRVMSREEKYSRFPGQKAVKKHIVTKQKLKAKRK